MRKGNAIVELVLGMGIFAVVVSATVSICRISVIRHRALGASRYGAQMLSSGAVSPEVAAAQMSRVLSAMPAAGVRWRHNLAPFRETAASRFYRLVAADVEAMIEAPGGLGRESEWRILERSVIQQTEEIP